MKIFFLIFSLVSSACGQISVNKTSDVKDMGLATVCNLNKLPDADDANLKENLKSLVQVNGSSPTSGFFINDKGYILTNWRGVEKCLNPQANSILNAPKECAGISVKTIKSIECHGNKAVVSYSTFNHVELVYPRPSLSSTLLSKVGLAQREVAILKVNPNELNLEKIENFLSFSNQIPANNESVFSLGFPVKTAFQMEQLIKGKKETDQRISSITLSYMSNNSPLKIELFEKLNRLENRKLNQWKEWIELEKKIPFKYQNADNTPRVSFGNVKGILGANIYPEDILTQAEATIVESVLSKRDLRSIAGKKVMIDKIINNYFEFEYNTPLARTTGELVLKLKYSPAIVRNDLAMSNLNKKLFANKHFEDTLHNMIIDSQEKQTPVDKYSRFYTNTESAVGSPGSPILNTKGHVVGIVSKVAAASYNGKGNGFDSLSNTVGITAILPLQTIINLNKERKNSSHNEEHIDFVWLDPQGNQLPVP